MMQKKPFREHHLLQLMESYDLHRLPLDIHIKNYFKTHPSLGSHDRAEIAEAAYGMIRWLLLIDHLAGASKNWETRYEIYKSIDPVSFLNDPSIPLHVRLSFPEELFKLISASHGEEQAVSLCIDCNFPAPTTVRANQIKTNRTELLQRWTPHYEVAPSSRIDSSILFHKKINFFTLPEFKQGLFEVQDEGSQLLANLVEAEPGQHILDYCAGSGGKTLAFAHKTKNTGQIYLHDLRSYILEEAKKRLKRAGIQNAQIICFEDPKLIKLKKRMDWVLVDAPCSGTGTLRRNPDMKWKFSSEILYRLQGQQRTIFEKALSYLKPEGRIIYATCSLLKEENEHQLAHFLKTYNLILAREVFQSLPRRGEMDGFFGAVMQREPFPL